MSTVLSYLAEYGPIVITAAAAAAATLPQGKAGSVWSSIRSVIDFLALNFGNAKNSPKV